MHRRPANKGFPVLMHELEAQRYRLADFDIDRPLKDPDEDWQSPYPTPITLWSYDSGSEVSEDTHDVPNNTELLDLCATSPVPSSIISKTSSVASFKKRHYRLPRPRYHLLKNPRERNRKEIVDYGQGGLVVARIELVLFPLFFPRRFSRSNETSED